MKTPWSFTDQLQSSSSVLILLTAFLALIAAALIISEERMKRPTSSNGRMIKKIKIYCAGVVIIVTLISSIIQINSDAKKQTDSNNKESELNRLQDSRDKKYDSDVYKELEKLDSTIKLQKSALDSVKIVLHTQSDELSLSNRIDVNTDPIDSSSIFSQLILKDKDDIDEINKLADKNGQFVDQPKELEQGVYMDIYLLPEDITDKQILDHIADEDWFFKFNWIRVSSNGVQFDFLNYMDIYQGTLFNWTQRAEYHPVASNISFGSLDKRNVVAIIKASTNYVQLYSFTIMNKNLTLGYDVYKPQLLNSKVHQSLYSNDFYNIFKGKLTINRDGFKMISKPSKRKSSY